VDGYLLDTCVVSALLDGQHKNYQRVRISDEAIESGAPRYVSRITIAELTFGMALHEAATGKAHPRANEVLRRAQEYGVREISKHTAMEYAELRKNLAVAHLPNLVRSQRPRWVDQWMDRVTQEALQIDENDLWICAQARECNLILFTTDEKMVSRIEKADPNINSDLYEVFERFPVLVLER
jgi:tRNA(fMet)-specific endonuclease VapC